MATIRTLTEADDGRDVVLGPEDDAVVHLVENASTGYQWSASASNPCVTVQDAGSEPPHAGAAPGAAGTHSFRLRAAAPGVCDVEFRLIRSWERDVPPERSLRVRLQVS